MTDKEFNDRYRQVKKLVERWIPRMGLDQWTIKINYIPDEIKCNTEGDSTTADVWCKWEYKKASIRFSIYSMLESTPAEIENTVVHELCHLMVNSMRRGDFTDHVRKCEEVAVVGLANAFLRTYRSAYKTAMNEFSKKIKHSAVAAK